MPILLIEIHQVGKDQAAIQLVQRRHRFVHAIRVALGFLVIADASPEENVENLADAEHSNAGIVKLIEQHSLGWGNGEVLAIGSAHERTGLAGKWARDHAAHLIWS